MKSLFGAQEELKNERKITVSKIVDVRYPSSQRSEDFVASSASTPTQKSKL